MSEEGDPDYLGERGSARCIEGEGISGSSVRTIPTPGFGKLSSTRTKTEVELYYYP